MKSLLTILTLSLAIAGCQGNDPFNRNSDPLNDYPEMKNDLVEKPAEADPQKIMVKTFDIRSDSDVESSRLLQFIAGEEASYFIRARSFVPETNFNLQIHNAPEGLKLASEDPKQGLWKLTWRPDKKFIPVGQEGWEHAIEVEFVILKGTNPRATNAHSVFEKKESFTLTVRHSDEQPFIEGSKELDDLTSVKAGAVINFSVVVTDPAGYGDFAPELSPTFDPTSMSKETNFLYGSFALTPQQNKSPTKLSEGRWRYYWTLDTNLIANKYKSFANKNGQISVEFQMRALSQITGNRSPLWNKALQIEIPAEPKSEKGAQ